MDTHVCFCLSIQSFGEVQELNLPWLAWKTGGNMGSILQQVSCYSCWWCRISAWLQSKKPTPTWCEGHLPITSVSARCWNLRSFSVCLTVEGPIEWSWFLHNQETLAHAVKKAQDFPIKLDNWFFESNYMVSLVALHLLRNLSIEIYLSHFLKLCFYPCEQGIWWHCGFGK